MCPGGEDGCAGALLAGQRVFGQFRQQSGAGRRGFPGAGRSQNRQKAQGYRASGRPVVQGAKPLLQRPGHTLAAEEALRIGFLEG